MEEAKTCCYIFYEIRGDEFFILEGHIEQPVFVFDEINSRMCCFESDWDSFVAVTNYFSSCSGELFLREKFLKCFSIGYESISNELLDVWFWMIESACDERMISWLKVNIITGKERFLATWSYDNTKIGFVG
jgi:hypothetical protein